MSDSTTSHTAFYGTALGWSVVLAVLLEVLVFNFRWLETSSYRTLTDYQLACAGLVLQEDGTYKVTDPKAAALQLTGFDAHIASLAFAGRLYAAGYNLSAPPPEHSSNLTRPLPLPLKFRVLATDAGHAQPLALPELESHFQLPRSWYTRFYLAGNSTQITIKLLNLQPGQQLQLDRLTLNSSYPFFFPCHDCLASLYYYFLSSCCARVRRCISIPIWHVVAPIGYVSQRCC